MTPQPSRNSLETHKKNLGAIFKGGKAIMEGGLHGEQHVRQDEPWIADLKAMHLKLVATFANGLNLTVKHDPTNLTEPWKTRVALNKAAGIEAYTMQSLHRIASEGGWTDARYERIRKWTLDSA
jgi:hypothetical protein